MNPFQYEKNKALLHRHITVFSDENGSTMFWLGMNMEIVLWYEEFRAAISIN